MPQAPARKADDRVFVRNGRRHYRRKYSINEVRIGAVLLVLLFALIGWVAWKGAHPDPALYATELPLLAAGEQPVEFGVKRIGAASSSSGRTEQGSASEERAPLPEGLAPSGWTEGAISRFDSENLYEKINGREGYYKAFGFEALLFVSLTRDDAPASIVDIEMFDLGTAANALGAYAGERSRDIVPEVDEMGMAHIDRNALLMTRGRLYVRAIGSDETPIILEQLGHLRSLFRNELQGEPLPWGFALFVGKMGLGTERVSFMPENAFSFGFAKDVYAALLDDDETELFVATQQNAKDAESLVGQFVDGFSGYGSPVGETGGVQWIEDRYIKTVAGTTQLDSWVLGVRGAPDIATAVAGLARLREAVANLPVPAIEAGASESEVGGEGDRSESVEESYQ